jgi:hypothetical protein
VHNVEKRSYPGVAAVGGLGHEEIDQAYHNHQHHGEDHQVVVVPSGVIRDIVTR